MSQHRTDAERRSEVEGWRTSGEGVKKYAARRGYSETTLRKWIAMDERRTGGQSVAPGLLRVVARSTVTAAESEVVVEVGAARIRVARAFDAALLRSVVLALSEKAS